MITYLIARTEVRDDFLPDNPYFMLLKVTPKLIEKIHRRSKKAALSNALKVTYLFDEAVFTSSEFSEKDIPENVQKAVIAAEDDYAFFTVDDDAQILNAADDAADLRTEMESMLFYDSELSEVYFTGYLKNSHVLFETTGISIDAMEKAAMRFRVFHVPYGEREINTQEIDAAYLRDNWGQMFTSENMLATMYPMTLSEWLSCGVAVGGYCKLLERDMHVVRIQ